MTVGGQDTKGTAKASARALEPSGPNSEQIQFWNETAGPRWVAHTDVLDAQIAPFGEAVMARLAVSSGERVLDVGCGCGQTTRALAARVGTSGRVLGVDISAPMLEQARGAASRAALAQAAFELADAQTHPFPESSFDVVFSRFGVMFFADPGAAFKNLRRALERSGRMGFVCWQPIAENPWMLLPVMAAAQHIPIPTPTSPNAPGPFAFADPLRVRGILEDAGFSDVKIDEFRTSMIVGRGLDLDATVDFVLELGPLGAALREAGPAARPAVAAAVREAIAPYRGESGVSMASAAWIVTAR